MWRPILGLLLLSALNWTQIGVQPCRQPAAHLVRVADWVLVRFGAAAVVAVPVPQATVILGGLIVQAIVVQLKVAVARGQ